MWKIDRIQARNIVSFKSLDYTIEQGVATLIFGENLDGTNQRHNGSGKSALIEAISIALTGDYLRDVKTTEELINDSANECVVTITLSNDYDGREFEISRTLSRKGAQVVQCAQYKDGEQVNKDKTIQPSVADYNKFILAELGLTKDDIYSNYILCRNKYVSFLSAKDKDKKELINRFSNGVMVDGSIDALMLDMGEVSARMNIQHDDVVRYQARIDTINEQIANAEQNRQAALQSRADKITQYEDKIAEKRGEIRELSLDIEKANRRLDHIDQVVGGELEELEKTDKSLSECFQSIIELFSNNRITLINNVSEQSESLHKELDNSKSELKQYETSLANAEVLVGKAQEQLDEVKVKYNETSDANALANAESRKKLDELALKYKKCEEKIAEDKKLLDQCRDSLVESQKAAEEISVKLHGAVTCPACGHKFVVDSKYSVDDLKNLLADEKESIKTFEETIAGFNSEIKSNYDDMAAIRNSGVEIEQQMRNGDKRVLESERLVREAMREVDKAMSDVQSFKNEIERVKSKVKMVGERLSGLRKNMFDNAFDIIDSTISRGENYVKELIDKKKYAKESINQCEEYIERLKKSDVGVSTEALQQQAKEYQASLAEVEAKYNEILAEYNTLKLQKEHFIAFKTYLANTKISAISQIINSFLEEIGSDIRVSIDGYRVLKSGKLSEKITINLLRDGVECGAFGKFSGGERSRVELASILAIQTLINTSCEDGKGLDFLALDEILEACDYEGISAACDTLNKLHKTSLVITQNPAEENYPYTLVVTKENGISTIG